MKYFIIRDNSDVDSRLAIFDFNGNEVFKVSGEISGNNQKMAISNMNGEEFVAITSSPFAFLHFRVTIGRKRIIFIMTPQAKSPMAIYGASVYFDGVLLTGDYKLTDHSKNIVATQKHSWCKFGECHELEILNEDYTLISLAVSSAISIYYGIYDENNTVPI